MWKKMLGLQDQADHRDENVRLSFERMKSQIDSVGGELHFSLKVNDQGWFSMCKEFPAIVSGGSNTNPTHEEILRSIVDAVKTAFDVPITTLNRENPLSQMKISYENNFSFA